jgi:proline iminopeptidase
MRRNKWFYPLVLFPLVTGCEWHTPETPGNLVPPTAAEDTLVPHLAVEIAGRKRMLHLRTFGSPDKPAIFALPGGPGTDFRLLLPLQALADRYFIVMWDPRGAGLSERVGREELGFESFAEEIAAVKSALYPNGSITLITHSFGALFALQYTADHPGLVRQLILIEPGPLTNEGRNKYNGGNISFMDGQGFFWQNEVLSSKDHASADYKAISVLPKSLRNFSCDGSVPELYPMWRFGAYHYHILTTRESARINAIDWQTKMKNYPGEGLIIAGTCGAASADLQTRYNLDVLPASRLEIIEGTNHYSLFTQYPEALVQVLKNNLNAYQ